MKIINQNLVTGILAHVDAGKTTLSEAILHLTGAVRRAGRVDHGDAFLDTDEMEKERGITIFSKQARFFSEFKAPLQKDNFEDDFECIRRTYTLLDTPGHADFSTEMERVLGVLDCAVLVISALDGVNGQVRVLWRLLAHYDVPVIVFVNKMDQNGADREKLLAQIHEELGNGCVDLLRGVRASEPEPEPSGSGTLPAQMIITALGDPQLQEELAVCDDDLLSDYLEGKGVTLRDLRGLIGRRKVFPVLFGSALREQGVKELLDVLNCCVTPPEYEQGSFGALVYKISRDSAGARLTWMKITGGSLRVKTPLEDSTDSKGGSEKVEQIRLYSGDRYQTVQEVHAGEICAVTGLTGTRAGEGLGIQAQAGEELLQPVLRCAVILPPGEDVYKAYRNLSILEEEEPMLRISYDEEKGEITAQVMGQVQREILQRVIRVRFGLQVEFGRPGIVYKETIADTVEGVGHFEPLRHYAEVHLLLEPGEPGSGLVFENRCRTDELAASWQRLIMTHLEERVHRGVLTGAEITDMKISLLTGKAHEKHTEGGDFRQATYRAVRQGLMMARSVLLEPWYSFRLELPQENLGRALTDLQQMGAKFSQPDLEGNISVISGSAPVSSIGDYAETVTAYSHGSGHITFSLRDYEPCKNAEEVILASGYDPDLDRRNPSASVFCSHGVGTIVPWYEVRQRMHVDSGWRAPGESRGAGAGPGPVPGSIAGGGESDGAYGNDGNGAGLTDAFGNQIDVYSDAVTRAGMRPHRKEKKLSYEERESRLFAQEEELRRIFERTYGPVKSSNERRNIREYGDEYTSGRSGISDGRNLPDPRSRRPGRKSRDEEYLLVDGYNIIFAWDELREIARTDIMAARDRLEEMLADFAGYRREHLILVFDAYKVRGGREEVIRENGIDVIYTKEAETADLYIEKAAHELSKHYKVTVATSDAVEQVIIYGAGAYRMSARNLLEELLRTKEEMRGHYAARPERRAGGLLSNMDEETAGALHEHLRNQKE